MKPSTRIPFLILLLGATIIPTLARPGEVVPGELLVRLNEGHTPAGFLRDLKGKRSGLSTLRYDRTLTATFNVHLFRFDPEQFKGGASDALLKRVRETRGVAAAQFNYEVTFRTLPDDPELPRQWGIFKTGTDEVWQITTGGKTARGDDIVVAVLDSGFDIDHEDLKDNIWINPGEIPDDRIDNDRNGYVDDVLGWNFVDSSAVHRVDQHGHSVAGIIGARGNNGIGVSGINWEIRLMLLDIRYVDQIVAAYAYVVEQRDRYNKTDGREGAFVVATNASFGQNRTFCEEQPVWGGMYDLLGKVGVLTGAGTANMAFDVEAEGDMPTTCSSDFLITTLNTTQEDEKYEGSAYGTTSIDIGSPGEKSYTTKPFDSYGEFSGNSAAAPHLTGAIALLYSLPCKAIAESALVQPAQTALQIREAIIQGVEPVPALEPFTATGGRLDVFRSLERIQERCGSTTGPLEIISLFPNPVSNQLVVQFETPDFEPYQLLVYNTLGQEIFRDEVIPSRFSVKQYRIPTSQWPAGVYFFRIRKGEKGATRKFLVQH